MNMYESYPYEMDIEWSTLRAENERLRAGWNEAQTFMALSLEREERQAEQIALLQEALQDIANHVPSIDRAYRVATESLARLAADAPATPCPHHYYEPEGGDCSFAHAGQDDAPATTEHDPTACDQCSGHPLIPHD